MAATPVEQLVLQMSADMNRLNRNVVQGQQTFNRQLTALERRAQQMDRQLSRTMAQAGQNMTNALRQNLTQIAPTLAAAFSAAQIFEYAEAWTQGRNALAGAGVAADDLTRRQERLVEIANASRTGTQETISLYTRLSIATQELGMGTETTLRLTELLNKSFQASGASTVEAASAALQLSQALASGVLQGDELRSLRESAPQLAKAIADSMGVSIGALKGLGAEGKITADIVANAILQAGDDIETKFNATTATVGQALTVLNNSLGQYVGQADSGISATGRMAQAIAALAENLNTIIPIVGVLVSLLGAKMVLALTANSGAMIANGVAAARLAAFQTAMTASMTGTTRAMVVATGASRAFGAALAANPVGAAIVAVAALAAAFGVLAARQREADQRVEEYRTSMVGAKDALDAYEDAARTAANATAQNAEQMRQSAEAARIDALFRLENARAIAKQTAELARQRAVEARVADQQANTIGTPYPGMMGGNAVRASQRSIQANREAQAAAEGAAEAEREYNRITKNMASGAYRVTRTPAVDTKPTKSSGSSGPSAEDLARQRELLALQAQLELLRAQGREEEARGIQRQIDIINVTKQFEDAKIENARDAAIAQVDELALAEAAARGREAAAERTKAWMEMVAEATQRQRDQQDRQNDALAEELQFRAELARLSGDPARIELAEREVYIAQRVNDLLREKVGLITDADLAAARNKASTEYDALDGAEREGAMREEFRSAFKDGIQAAIDGDMGGLFESLADRFTSRMLDNLADDLFDLLSEAAKGFGGGGGGGGGWLSSIASIFGARATGGPVTAGAPYIVGERRPEVFVPNVNGTVIPSVNAAMNKVTATRAGNDNLTVNINLDGANGDDTIRRISFEAAAQGTALAIQQSRSERAQQARTAPYRRH